MANQTSGRRPGPPMAGPGPDKQLIDLNEIGASRTPPAWILFLAERWQLAAGVVAAALVAAAGLGLMNAWRDRQLETAKNDLGQVLTRKSEADKVAALKELVDQVPAGLRPAVLAELAKAQTAVADLPGAAETWGRTAENAPLDLKILAGLGQAAALTKAGQPAQAVAALERLGTAPESYEAPFNRQLAASAEQAGQWSKAAQACEALKKRAQPQEAAYLDQKIAALRAKAGA